MELKTGENDKGRRLDRVLRKALPDYPLPLLHRLLRQGLVLVDGKPARAQTRVDSGALITIPLKQADEPREKTKPASPSCPLPSPDVIWQGPGLIAVNKPVGIDIHGPGSIDDMVGSFLADKIPPSLSFKPGPLHRLDKNSSGIVVFSTDIEGARLFSALIRELRVRKTYLALIEGTIDKDETWKDELVRDTEKRKTLISPSRSAASKTAVTFIKPLAANGSCCLVMAEIQTGRTHQIRAQAAAHGHPLAGDRKYGGHGQEGFFLHAWKLEFLEYAIEAPLPQAFIKKIAASFGFIPEF